MLACPNILCPLLYLSFSPTPFPFLTELPVCTRKPQNCGLQGQPLQVSGSGVLTLTALELGLPAPSPSLSSGNSSPEKPDLLVGMPLSPSCQATAWCTPATKVLSLTPATVFPLHQRCWPLESPPALVPRVGWTLVSQPHSQMSRQIPSIDTMEELFFPGQRAIATCRGPVITSEMGPVLRGPPPPSVSLWGKWFPHRLLAVLFSPSMETQWDPKSC